MEAYSEAHLFVAAIRLCHHKEGTPPSLKNVCSMLNLSEEAGHAVCRKLDKLGIIEILEDPFSVRLAVANFLEIEKIPQQSTEDKGLARELEEFKAKKQDMDQKVATIQADIKKKKDSMFADIESKLKKEMEKFQKG